MIEPDVEFEPSGAKVTTTFKSATEFGLTPGEIWETVMTTLDRLPEDTKVRYIDELAGALATRLLEKERRL
jgi:hypothetical protein